MHRRIQAPGVTRGVSRARGAIALGALLSIAFAMALLFHERGRAPRPSPRPTLSSAAPAPSEPAPAGDVTPEIRGHVLDADGNSVPGATVRLVSASPPFAVYSDARTDRSGFFSFARVGPWRVRVVAEHGPDGVVTSALLQAAEGRTTEVTLVLSAAGAIRGTVVDAQDRPVAGAVISVEGVPWIVPAATSDGAGAFRLTTVPDQATSLVAVARGYKTARAPLGPRVDQAERLVRVTLTAAERVLGDVRDDEGNPARARVVACEDQPAEVRVTSGEDGTFELPPSAIGCAAIAEHAGYAPSDVADVLEGRRLVLHLKAGGSVEGIVVNERGEGLPSFTLGIESFSPVRGWTFDHGGPRTFDGESARSTARSTPGDQRGSFRWDRLAPGTYVLTAAGDGVPPGRSGSIDVRGGSVTRGVRIVLPQGGTLTGAVYDERHTPLGGADVRFDQVSSVVPSKVFAQTDANGIYRLQGAPAGPLSLLVRKDGFRTRLVTGVRVDSGTTRRQDVTLAALDGGGSLELGGIGAALTQTGGGISLGEVYSADPAARAGLRAGDRILRIDGEPTDGMSMADVLQRLRGEPGTSVGVSVVRPGTGEEVELTIVRGQIVR